MAIGNIIEIEVEKLIKAKWNYKKDDKKKMANLVNSIKMHSQIELLLVRELKDGFEVVNGNHRVDALIELKIEKALCYNLGKIPEKQAKLIAVQTNEIRFDSDFDKLNIILDEIEFFKFNIKELIPLDILDLISNKETDSKEKEVKYIEKYQLMIEVKTEKELKKLYEKLDKEGYKCKISIL